MEHHLSELEYWELLKDPSKISEEDEIIITENLHLLKIVTQLHPANSTFLHDFSAPETQIETLNHTFNKSVFLPEAKNFIGFKPGTHIKNGLRITHAPIEDLEVQVDKKIELLNCLKIKHIGQKCKCKTLSLQTSNIESLNCSVKTLVLAETPYLKKLGKDFHCETLFEDQPALTPLFLRNWQKLGKQALIKTMVQSTSIQIIKALTLEELQTVEPLINDHTGLKERFIEIIQISTKIRDEAQRLKSAMDTNIQI
jgi:hypothetical protein